MSRGSLGFGIVRSADAVRGRARLAELCELMSRDLDTIFVPHHPDTYAELVRGCERREFALAWMPPVAATKLVDSSRAKVLVLPVRRGNVSYQAAVIARTNGPGSIRELAGSRAAWVDRESSSGYIVPRLFLQGANLNVDRLFSSERFVLTHGAVVDAVVSASVDIGGTYCGLGGPGHPVTFAQPASAIRGPWTGPDGTCKLPLVVLATTGAIPNDAILAGSSLDLDMQARVRRWLITLPGRARTLCKELFDADSFRIAADEHFEPLRSMLSAARARSTLRPPPGA